MRSVVRTLAVLCITLVAAGSAAAAAAGKRTPASPPAPRLQSAEDVLLWINNYRLEPEPQQLPAAVKAMTTLGLLRDPDTAGVYIGFVAGVLASNPDKSGALVSAMFPLPPEDQGLVVKAIAYSGAPEWKQTLTAFIEQMPARRKLIDKYLFGKEPLLFDVALDSGPAAIDALWGYYFATGSERPVKRIITALAWSSEKSDVTKLTIGSMAKWTLASNASRDRHLLRLCRDESERKDQVEEVAKPLKDIIEAAENFETTRIRKDALAAIEDLKRKGPSKEWSWSSFGVQSAPTVIALGCVAATVAGQAEVGIPCVVSGALSSAVAKLWGGVP